MARKSVTDGDGEKAPSDLEGGSKPRGRRKKNAPLVMPRHQTAADEPDPSADAAISGAVAKVAEGKESDFLLTYFKDLTRLSLLSPAAEYELARRIGIMEEVLWVQLLSLAPLTKHLVELIETDLGKSVPELRTVQTAATELCGEGKLTGKPLAVV